MSSGSMSAAITTLKNNRNLLKKRALKSKKDVYGIKGVTKLNLKKSTDQDMKRIRKKIRGYKREERSIWFTTIVVTILFVYVVAWLILGS